jgi:hypothetical protein
MKKKLNWYRDTDMILEKMIDAELKSYNIRMKDIIDSKDWFSKYTFKTKEEHQEWKNYCIDLMTKEVSPKRTIKEAEREFTWLDVMYGLKCEYEE